MKAEGRPFTGVLFAGLMITPEGPKLIEFNVRFGDPECQTLMRRLTTDLAPVLLAAAKGELASAPALEWDPRPAVTVVYAAQGYPDEPLTGSVIRGVAGSVARWRAWRSSSPAPSATKTARSAPPAGACSNVTATGEDLKAALARAYASIRLIDWPGGFCRSDIGWRALR